MALVRDDRDRFAGLVAAAAAARGLDPSLVEKDYWAVEALRSIHGGFDVRIGDEDVHIQPIFKGGTSLSKAFGLIERFSEDIDLLVPVPFDDPGGYSQAQRTEVMRATTDAVSASLAIDGQRKGGRRGVDRHWLYPYVPVGAPPDLVGVEPSIRVEITVMGGMNPRSEQTISAMVADHATAIDGFPAYDDLTPVTIETLRPERTLVEKLAMLHDAAHQALSGESSRLQGSGRHYYDVAMLLRSDSVRSALTSTWVAEIAADADRWSGKGNFPFTPRPDDGFAVSPAFTEPALMDIMTASYTSALDWVWGDKPSLQTCIATVLEHVSLL